VPPMMTDKSHLYTRRHSSRCTVSTMPVLMSLLIGQKEGRVFPIVADFKNTPMHTANITVSDHATINLYN